MMRIQVFIGALAVAILMGACVGTSPNPTGESAASPGLASKSAPRLSDSGKIPDWSLELARKKYLGVIYTKDVEEAKARLRLLVVRGTQPFTTKTRAYMVENDWDQGFIKEFDEIVAWYDQLWKGPPNNIYEEAHVFLTKGLTKEGYKTNESIGEELLFVAGALGYHKGLLEYAWRLLDVKSESLHSVGRSRLRETANMDYVPAQLDIADRYLNGRGFGRSLAKALYWLGRAAMKGADVKGRIETLKAEISVDEYVQILKWTSREFPPRE